MNTIHIEKEERGVAVLALTRAEKHNAMSAEMIADLTQAAAQLGADESVRAVVLTGTGLSFCAGGDLGWMKAQMSASRDERMDGARALAHMLRALNEMPKPLIGRVQGNAFGGGVGLMSVCDIAIAQEGAKIGLTETRLGLIPATISPYVIARMGEAKARRVFMSGKVFEAAEAKELGLVAKVVIPEHLDLAIEAEVRPYLAAAPGAVAAAKALARALGPVIDDAAIEMTVAALADTWETPAAKEGISAFFEKRKPGWQA